MHAGSKQARPSPAPSALPTELQQAIRRRAEEIYERSGRIRGRDVENWIRAEAEIRHELEEDGPHKASIVVKVDGGEAYELSTFLFVNPRTNKYAAFFVRAAHPIDEREINQ